ncbi:S8 family serine peptidase [Aquabacterium sp.]|uniref:S8 family serine peptidase n=1 Tax=Aquabacterium sp. TaxID=1872578 RepID=UPI0019915E4F|nr:S8 family serine peptidase [Aquabacterium sp.]MBC7700006.1 S8 family serine peptidase [Aquabacterium sp.]
MIFLRRLALPAAIALLMTAPASLALAAEDAARVIVKFKAGSVLMRAQAQSASPQRVAHALSLGQRIGRTLHDGPGLSSRTQVVLADGLSSAQLAARLAQESDVEYAVVDHKRFRLAAPNDTLYGDNLAGFTPTAGQWYLRAPIGALQSSINVEPAWDITHGSASVVVAVLDTGIRDDHADLRANLLPGYDMVTDVGMANDDTGRDADASDPGDWITYAETTGSGQFAGCGRDDNHNLAAENSTWHGTQTTGLIGALTNNGIGMASVGRNVRILPVRVLGKCGGYDSDIMAGMLWAAGISVSGVPANPNPAKVINLSLGGSGACTQAYRDTLGQLTTLGVTVVASAGNSGLGVTVPANCPGVIGVAGLRHVGTKVGYSDLGPEITISAPAGNCVNTLSGQPCLYPILTTSNAGTTTPIAASNIYTDSYYTSLGTSFSAPMVSGTIGLMLSVNPALTPAAIRTILMGSARAFPTTGGDNGDGGSTSVPRCAAPSSTEQAQCYCTPATCGAGMLDTGAAVAAANAGLQAQIDFSKTGAVPSQALAISGVNSWVASGRSIAAYQWTLVDGGGIVAPLTSASGSSISVTPSALGRFTVRLTITDDLSATSTTSQTIDVVTPTAVTTVTTTPASGGGGGALGGGTLLGLLAALISALALARRERTQASRKA